MVNTNRFQIPSDWPTKAVRVAVIGAGGTGSQLIDQLASLNRTLIALGATSMDVTVYDHDKVSASNIGRQRFTQSDIGNYKTTVLVHRINLFYNLNWKAVPERFTVSNKRDVVRYDLIITCVDSARFRAALGGKYRHVNISTLWLDIGNGESTGQVIFGHLGRGMKNRLPNVFDLYPDLATGNHDANQRPSCSVQEAIARQSWPINRLAALSATELLWHLFRNGSIDHHGAFFSLNPMTSSPLQIDPDQWMMFGYVPAKDSQWTKRRTKASNPKSTKL